ncbi:hypothetical protein BCR32DRAFT_283207 [Anaeromyces robustus]|uniref:Uncharacterized protein n=1 Tax=Anaeromyces robustus TaxID=1754192 RepID=A0A1Y1WV41_9FUNG|nr:hypothetical protein BCR32DRAFT_283207 [Anaeromyces robustus]|eukprot:ORX77421.1 hypothetical protein BCR32DRAFT_283207 [Anaeromyces robustus]
MVNFVSYSKSYFFNSNNFSITVTKAVFRIHFVEPDCLGMQSKMGGKFHLELNIRERLIANKYCEGKMKRIMKFWTAFPNST